MEKTAAGVPVHEPKQDCQPPIFCISGIVFALGLALPGEGDDPGDGEGAAVALCGAVACPPHPATAAQAVKVKTTRLGRNRFFSFSILGNSPSGKIFETGDVLCSLSRSRIDAGFLKA
jgi:hypothetical protein